MADDAASASADAGRVPLRLPQRAAPPAGRAAPTRSNAQLDHLCALRFQPRRARLPARPALHQARLRRLPAHLPLPARASSRRAPTATALRDRRARAAGARDGVRDLRAGHRQRAVLPPLRPRRRAGRRPRAAGARRSSGCAPSRAEPARAHPFEFFDFGVRRRFAGDWQRGGRAHPAARACPQFFKGTSNVLLARDLDLVPIGTMAHEYLQTFQAFGVRLRDFQQRRARGLGAGVPRRPRHRAHRRRRHGRLPAPTSTSTSPSCSTACATTRAIRSRGARRRWRTTRELRIDAHTKRLVFSDALDLDDARSRCTATSPTARSWASASAPTSPTTSASSRSTS